MYWDSTKKDQSKRKIACFQQKLIDRYSITLSSIKGLIYSQAVALDRTVYFSGVLGLNKDSMKLVDGGAVAEARQALQNLGQLLEAADSSYDKVVKTNIFLTDMNDFSAVNEIYKECRYTYVQHMYVFLKICIIIRCNVSISISVFFLL